MRNLMPKLLTWRNYNKVLSKKVSPVKLEKHSTQLSFYKMMASISAQFVAAKNEHIDAAINNALTQIGEFFNADRSYVFSFSENHHVADNTHEWCAAKVTPQLNELKNIPLDAYGGWYTSWQAGEITCISDIAVLPSESLERKLLEPQGIKSVIMIPLRTEDKLLGMFGLDIVKSYAEWTEEHISLLSIIAETIANSLLRKRSTLSIHLQQTVGQITVRFINLPVALIDNTINNALTQLREFFDFSHALLLEAESVPANYGEPNSRKPNSKKTIYGFANDFLPNLKPEYYYHTCVLFPIVHGKKHYGYLTMVHENKLIFDNDQHIESLSLIAEVIAGTYARRDTEKQNEYLAFYHPVSGLPNRRFLDKQIEQVVAGCDREQTCCAIVFIDIDHFKHTNDTLGRELSDKLLQHIGQRVQQFIEAGDTAAHLGADQFVLIIEQLGTDIDSALRKLQRASVEFKNNLEQPFQLENKSITVSACIGVSFYCGADPHELDILNQAELAMFKAKSFGRGSLRYFDPQMQESASKRALLYDDLKVAITENQFEMYYQLQVNRKGKAIAAEALVRWHHPERGMVSPNEFIDFAEETNLIEDISEQVIALSCKQLADWGGHPVMNDLELSINISAQHMLKSDFMDTLQAILQMTKAPTEKLKFEITESALIADTTAIVKLMKELNQLGIRFSLDDFGTGYSSLSYLKAFPITELKLDLRFVHDMVTNNRDYAIAAAVIILAKELDLIVVAEGVETNEQRDLLLELGCDSLQGYLYSRPLPAEQVVALTEEINAKF
ncbi:sensor domain-containing phosphodiesterase [Idiomarina sp. A28L]|uniref:sensor domain-containing phosphodiesterase n=1 Tax=Idiomarina sp. A28L TaxID=1036674 RepID=UPI0013021359|nr:GGDEF domain-containing protein [Idiomarina sp. A28L]